MARLELGGRRELRLLQFTDIHLYGGVKEGLPRTEADAATERDCRDFVRHFRPDAVLVTGDFWHDNPGGRGEASLRRGVALLEALEVPWAFCWGNHDLLNDYGAGHETLEKASRSLYRGGATHGDYQIEVRGGATDGGVVVARLWLMNSNRYGLTPWQLAWLRQARAARRDDGERGVPALAFFHIPLLQQKELYRAGETPGLFLEEVCHEQEAGGAAPMLAEDARLLACFCGHDHVNDYMVRSGQLELVYGRATGHAGYGGDKVRKGAKLIEVDLAAGACRHTTVFADGSRWTPG